MTSVLSILVRKLHAEPMHTYTFPYLHVFSLALSKAIGLLSVEVVWDTRWIILAPCWFKQI